MNETHNLCPPTALAAIQADTQVIGFQMASDARVGPLLRTLAASKRVGRFLDLGTGTGLSAVWLLDGMGTESRLLGVDNDPALLAVAKRHLGHDERLQIVCDDGDRFIRQIAGEGQKFDFIFADMWAGKYRLLEETLNLLHPNGLYVIDDMLPQPNWPDGHQIKVNALIASLESRPDLRTAKMAWSSGVVVCAKT